MERIDPLKLVRSLKAQIDANAKQLRRTRRLVADIDNHLTQNEPDQDQK